MTKYLKLTIAIATVAATAMIFSSCQKEQLVSGNGIKPVDNVGKNVTLSEDQIRKVQEISAQIPIVRLYDEANNRYMDINIYERWNRDWSFSNPYEGAEYSETGVWENADGTEMIVLTLSATTSGPGGGGTVVAGTTTLDIDYAFCFNIDVQAVGIDLFDFGGSFDGVSGVIGIAGDFEALANDELGDDPDFEDFFEGFAAYIIYDGQANGSYDVLNWFEDLEGEADDLEDHAFSYVLDWNDFALYFSSGGTISASGASLSFEGEYLSLLDFITSIDEEEEETPEAEMVDGFGQMGCDL